MSAPMCKLRGGKKHLTNNKIILPLPTKTIQKTYLDPKWGERKLISFIKNQSETAIVKQLY